MHDRAYLQNRLLADNTGKEKKEKTNVSASVIYAKLMNHLLRNRKFMLDRHPNVPIHILSTILDQDADETQ